MKRFVLFTFWYRSPQTPGRKGMVAPVPTAAFYDNNGDPCSGWNLHLHGQHVGTP